MRWGKPQAACVGALVVLLLAGCSLGDDPSQPPQLDVESGEEGAAAKLGFPASATRDTVRVGGGDSAATAAGVASALFPATSQANRPTAAVLIDGRSWLDAVSASVLAGSPIGAPILIADGDDLPGATRDTLERLRPTGSDLARGAQVIRIGADTARPAGWRTALIEGADPYERAAAIDRFFSAARARPSSNVVIVSGEDPGWAMPAAAWAARSGDAVLPVRRDSIPAPVRRALRQHERPDLYVLGPRKVIGAGVARELGRLGTVRRIAAPTPVAGAVAFARYRRGGFGWGVVVPGYNFTLASTSRPLDAAAAAALATHGVFAPLLLTDSAERLPRALESYLLSVQPGYEDDPGQAVYNRVWILGDDEAVSVEQQARVDALAELIPVQANAP